jgi:ABC-type phosphate/phosphonate transport system substrate-binding protein
MAHPGVAQTLPEAGLNGVVVLATDSHQDLIQRMDAGEFDLVFCTSMDYVSQTGPYEALFQLRRPRDRFDPQGERVYHSGVIFVNHRSPLFRGNASPAEMGYALLNTDIAMVGSFSAAGYVYPVVKIASLTSDTLPVRVVFCDSPEEVVKHVVNGVYGAGACDAGVVEEVLSAAGLTAERDALLRVVLETDPIPADPVVVRTDWLPRNSELGRQLRDALRQFFTGRPDLPRLQAATDANFDDLRRNLARLRELRQ